MRKLYRPGVFAFSPETGEEYSANPADYWYFGPSDRVADTNDEPMILVRRSVRVKAV